MQRFQDRVTSFNPSVTNFFDYGESSNSGKFVMFTEFNENNFLFIGVDPSMAEKLQKCVEYLPNTAKNNATIKILLNKENHIAQIQFSQNISKDEERELLEIIENYETHITQYEIERIVLEKLGQVWESNLEFVVKHYVWGLEGDIHHLKVSTNKQPWRKLKDIIEKKSPNLILEFARNI